MKLLTRLFLAFALFFGVDCATDIFLKHGLDQGMGLNSHSKVLIVGHSHLMMGLDKDIMEKELHCKVSKHTRSGVGMAERYMMTKMFLNSPYSDSLQVVILGVDPFSFNGSGLSENCYTLFYPWMDDLAVKEYIKHETDEINYYVHKVFRTSRYSDDLIKQSFRGWMNDDRNYKTTVFTDSMFTANKAKWNRPILFNQELMNKLEDTIKLCTDRGIRVILLQTPLLRILTDLHTNDYEKILSYYHQLDSLSPLVTFLNYCPEYDNNYNLFFDPIHLNVNGQKKVSERIIDDLQFILR